MLGMRTLVVPLLGFMCYHLQGPCPLSCNLCSISFSTTVGLNEVSCSRISDVSGKRNLLYKIWIELKLSVGVSLWTSFIGGFSSCHLPGLSSNLRRPYLEGWITQQLLAWEWGSLKSGFSKILWLWWSFLPLYAQRKIRVCGPSLYFSKL